MKNGFIKVAAASPDVRVADCKYNVKSMIDTFERADRMGVKVLVFPELSITSCSCGDIFLSSTLADGATAALIEYTEATAYSDTVSVVGLPIWHLGKLYNSAAICQSGQVLAIVPKQTLSGKDRRIFSSPEGIDDHTGILIKPDTFVPFGTGAQVMCLASHTFTLSVLIGDEAFGEALDKTDIVAVPTASPELVGADEYRRTLVKARSALSHCGIIYSSPGYGESSTDQVFAAHGIICENGRILAESAPFTADEGDGKDAGLTVSEIDTEILRHDRAVINGGGGDSLRTVFISLEDTDTELTRKYPLLPFVPENGTELFKRAETVLEIQASGLRRRMEAAYAKKLIIGISGGLDSTLALLVAARACDRANRPRTDIIGITMPCFGTTSRTRSNAELLCEELGIEFRTVMIGDSVKLHLDDIGHDINNRNVVYENAQARERTQVLMDIANAENGLVVGTGDMSELALGWATYNGDHMSMYGVNASVPKTLVRALTGHCADIAASNGNKRLSDILTDIIDTPVSPELLPSDGDQIKQKTEDLVGPYEIHDFYLYYMLRYGFSPKKLFRIACYTLGGAYTPDILLKWLETFIKRFFSQQYKRSCLPDGPAVGTVGLSPRGALSMPSDASSALWLSEIEELKASIMKR